MKYFVLFSFHIIFIMKLQTNLFDVCLYGYSRHCAEMFHFHFLFLFRLFLLYHPYLLSILCSFGCFTSGIYFTEFYVGNKFKFNFFIFVVVYNKISILRPSVHQQPPLLMKAQFQNVTSVVSSSTK